MIILHVNAKRAGWWRDHLQSLLPEWPVRLWDDVGDDSEIEFAVVWKPPIGGLRRFQNLKAIVSIGAGIDHILCDPLRPANVPIIRTTGPDLIARMREYVCLHVLRFHRNLDATIHAQAERRWDQPIYPIAANRTVGIMGLGRLGLECARALQGLGFKVRGWRANSKAIPNLPTYAGQENLPAFLRDCEILVCLLPLTEATRGILNRKTFGCLPKGAAIINCARGQHLVESDLLTAIETKQVSAATLDVFEQEPLPQDHPFWAKDEILITAHTASLIDPETGGRIIANNLRRFHAGEPIDDIVEPGQDY